LVTGRALVPVVGELLSAHTGLIADFHVVPSGGRSASTLLPPGARALVLRRAEAEGA
jgi:hypothetical protein